MGDHSFLHLASGFVRPFLTLVLAASITGSGTLGANADADGSTATHEAWSGNECLARVDAAASSARSARNSARSRHESLLEDCPDVPQLHHNLAVLDAREGEWDSAIARLESAIALDRRAADSVNALRSIHRWHAAKAYARALDSDNQPKAPTLEVQTSRDVNSDARRLLDRDADLYDTTVIEYELWEWWRSATEGKRSHHREHYVEPDAAIALLISGTLGTLPDWESVRHSVRFTGREAVATLSWTSPEASTSHDLVLLLRLQNDRWRIHEELHLP